MTEYRNLLLRWIASQQMELALQLTPWHAAAGQMIWRHDEPIRDLIFVERGIVTACAPLGERAVPLWIVGGWFVLGGRQLFQGKRGVTDFVAHTDAYGWSVPRKMMRTAVKTDPPLRQRVRQLIGLMELALRQTLTCLAARHTAEQRLCRHLLMMDDAVEDHVIALSIPVIGDIAGLSRSTVERLAHALAQRQVITTSRRDVVIIDRAAVERHACACYRGMIERRDQVFVSDP